MFCAPYKRSLDILQQNWTFSTKGQKLQILCVWQKRTGEVKVHLLVSYVLIIAASEKMDYPRKWTIHYKGRKRALNVLCQPDQGKSWSQVPGVWVDGYPSCFTINFRHPLCPPQHPDPWLGPNSSATGKHIQECGILSHLGSVNLQILSNILQDVYLTVCWYQKDTHHAVILINKTIYCLKLKIRQ